MKQIFVYLLWGNDTLDSKCLRQVCDCVGQLPGNVDLTSVDKVHQQTECREGDIIEDDNREVTGTGSRKELGEVGTAGTENNLVKTVVGKCFSDWSIKPCDIL